MTTTIQSRPGASARMTPRPFLLIVGDDARTLTVARSLTDSIKTRIEREKWSQALPLRLADEVLAIVLVGSLPETPMRRAVRALRDSPVGEAVALFVVVRDGTDEADIRELYRQGATAAFEWPRESSMLPRVIVEMLSTVELRGRAREPDSALARAVRARFKLMRAASRGVHVRVRDGYVFLSGRTDSLWHKPKLQSLAAEVPGVTGVVAHDLVVAPMPASDPEIRRRVLRVMRDTSDIDEATLAVRVEDGHVVLSGTVAQRSELDRVMELLGHVKGVRSIERLAVVSGKQKQRDRTVVARLRRLLAERFPQEQVEVSFFGATAVLSGRVHALVVKRLMEQTMLSDPGVARLVNKVEVAPRGASSMRWSSATA